MQKIYALLFFCVLVIAALPATADKGGKGKDKNRAHYSEHYKHDDDKVTIRIDGEDHDIIRRYLRKDAFAHCPPGLAKKNPPCVPPGQAKKWQIGYPLPDDVLFFPVPYEWGLHAPPGYHYVRVDKDVLLIGEASKKVIDAVTLLSAVGE